MAVFRRGDILVGRARMVVAKCFWKWDLYVTSSGRRGERHNFQFRPANGQLEEDPEPRRIGLTDGKRIVDHAASQHAFASP